MSEELQKVFVVAGLAAALLFLGTQDGPRRENMGVAPKEGVVLPVSWGTLGAELVALGIIDRGKFEKIYGGLSAQQRAQLEGDEWEMRLAPESAPYLLNLLWALGLANQNPILAEEMADSQYGGAGGFASTGGWTIAKGSAMEHYNRHSLVRLTEAQQALVDDVSRHIYRPCCDNPTHFPDCNHGMAMFALLELMASQGAGERTLYETALVANSYWFPERYRTLAAYFASQGIGWKNLDPKEVLGTQYSSVSGYARIAARMRPARSEGQSCGA